MTLLDCGWNMNRFWRCGNQTLGGMAKLRPVVMLVLVFGAISVPGWVGGVRASAAEPSRTPSIEGVCDGSGRAGESESRACAGQFEGPLEVAQNSVAPRPSATSSAVGPVSALDVIMTAPATAEVWIDGNEAGDTSRQTTGISPGSHYVKIASEGYVPAARVLEFVAGVPTVWRGVTLVAKPASLLVSMLRPDEAEVLVDGKSVGATGKQIEGLKQGTHLLVVQKAGFESHREMITVDPGELLRISNVILERLSAELMVEMVVPYSADVVIDGTKQGTTGTAITGLVPGPTEVVVQSEGYESKTIRVELVANETRVIRGVTLKPMPATLAVECNTMGAEVVVDGKVLGKTTGGIDNFVVPAASRQIVVRRSGYAEFKQSLQLAPGGVADISVDLSTHGSTSESTMPIRTKRVAVGDSMGYSFLCGITHGGLVICHGAPSLDDGYNDRSALVGPVLGVQDAVDMSSGWNHACAVTRRGRVRCWGANQRGELGNGSELPVTGSLEVVGISDAILVDVSNGVDDGGDCPPPNYNFSCALLRDGQIACWGDNGDGQLGDGTTESRSVPVMVHGIKNAVSVSVGWDGVCALLEDGTVQCWGGAVSIKEGPGVVENWAGPVASTPVLVRLNERATQVSVGRGFACALLLSGKVACWGDDSFGTRGDGVFATDSDVSAVLGLENATMISAGVYHICAIKLDQSVVCWGRNNDGQSGSARHNVKDDSSWGLPYLNAPFKVRGLEKITELSAGAMDTCAINVEDRIICWGQTRRFSASSAMLRDTAVEPTVPVRRKNSSR